MSSVLTTASSFYQQVLRSASPKRMTVLVVIVLGLLGTIAWTQAKDKEQYLIQRNFRLLNLFGNDISQKISSYEKVLKTTLDGAVTHLRHDEHHSTITQIKKPNLDRKRLVRRLGSKAGEATTLSALQNFSGKCHEGFAKAQRKNNDESEEFLDLLREFHRLCEAEGLEGVSVKEVNNQSGERDLKVLTRQSPPRIQLTYTKSDVQLAPSVNKESLLKQETPLTETNTGVTSPKSGRGSETPPPTRVAIEAKCIINLKTFLDRLWRHQIYDEILLFEKPGPEENKSQSLIYHSGASEMPWRSFQELKEFRVTETFVDTFSFKEKSKGKDTASLQDKYFTISVPGQAFKVFTQPIRFPSDEKQEWVLVGLVQQEKFVNSSLAISSTLLLGMMFLLLGLVLGIPLFHLKTMGPKDPLRPVHVLGLLLSALLGSGFVTFLILDISIYIHGKGDLEDRMTESAQNIKDEMFIELQSVLETLTAFDSNKYLKDDHAEIFNIPSNDNLEVRPRPVLLEENISLNNLRESDRLGEQDPYADFLYAFWMDHDGSLRINWARDEFQGKPVHGMTQNFSLHERNYVRKVIDSPDRLWKFPDKPQISPFFLQPIISWTTGLNTVVASMRANDIAPTEDEIKSWVAPMEYIFPSQLNQVIPPPRTGFTIIESSKPWIAAIEFKFKSLMDQIVLPPGIGFAVIDNADQQVLFHSDEWRNLREPFLVETDDNPMLRDLLSAQTAGHAEGSYWGKPHSFYLLPLDPIPWSLVVFRNMEILRSVNLVGLLISGFLFSFWAFSAYVALWIYLRWHKRHRRAPWLWPDFNKRTIFLLISVANIFLFCWVMALLIAYWDNPAAQLMAAWLGPFFWIVVSVGWFLKTKTTSKNYKNPASKKKIYFFEWLSRCPYPQSYSLILTTYLLVLGVAPAFGCFSAVFNQEIKLFTQYQIQHIVQASQSSSGNKPFLQDLNNTCSLKTAANESFQIEEFLRGTYPEFYSSIKVKCSAGTKDEWQQEFGQSREQTFFQKGFSLLAQPFSPLIKQASLLGFISNTWPKKAKANRALWDSDGQQVTLKHLLTENQRNSTVIHTLSFSTNIPFIPWFLNPSIPTSEQISGLRNIPFENYLAYILILGLVAGLVYLYLYMIPNFIANRILFLSYSVPTSLPTSLLFSHTQHEIKQNRVVIGFPGQGKTKEVKETSGPKAGIKHFDLKTESPPRCFSLIQSTLNDRENELHEIKNFLSDKNISPEKTQDALKEKEILEQPLHIILDHFDHQWKDPKQNLEKLRLLEKLYQQHWDGDVERRGGKQ